jgi:methylmalonyl-CoA mutase N-terminal domain/subunit
MDPKGFERQCARLVRLRKQRDAKKHTSALDAVQKAAEGDDNLMPHFITAVRADATLGELCEVLRGVFGEYREPSEF